MMEVITPRPLTAMSEDQLKAFLETVRDDIGLREKLKAAEDVDAVVEIAKAAGFVISAEELKSAQAAVSEEELEGVAGGTFAWAAGAAFYTAVVGGAVCAAGRLSFGLVSKKCE